MLQGGYSTGFILSSLVYQYVYPLVNQRADFGWRVMFWMGILPAFLVLFIMKGSRRVRSGWSGNGSWPRPSSAIPCPSASCSGATCCQ
jgi:MFS family permease